MAVTGKTSRHVARNLDCPANRMSELLPLIYVLEFVSLFVSDIITRTLRMQELQHLRNVAFVLSASLLESIPQVVHELFTLGVT